MTLFTWIVLAAGLLATLATAAFTLPRQVTVTRSATVDAAPGEVFALIASNAGYQRFNPYKSTDPDLKIDLFGPDQGVGSGFRFDGREGKGSQTVTAVVPDRSVTMQIDLGAMGKPTQQFDLAPAGSGTRVTWSMQADMGANPVARVFGLFMDRMMGKTFETGLTNLDAATAG